jgi:transcriptional regulator with XRE-family HTH domain
MRLNQPEIIQILRKRARLNQGTFGATAFNTSFESGRTKVKNIELGKQKPTQLDLERMAAVLDVSVSDLVPIDSAQEPIPVPDGDFLVLSDRCLELFPGLDTYLDMLMKAVTLEDEELISHISGKIASLFDAFDTAQAVNQ